MSDPLVQELREAAKFIEVRHWRAPDNYACARLMTDAAEALDAAHQREQAQLFLLATVKRLLLQHNVRYPHFSVIDEALQELDGIDAAADLRRADRDPAVPGLSEK